MYLPTNPNACSREINSRRRSVAASMSSKTFGLGKHAPPPNYQLDETTDLENHNCQTIYKHGTEGSRLLCPWCISESSITPRSSSSNLFSDERLTTSYFKNDVSRELYVLDDRLYDYIETHACVGGKYADAKGLDWVSNSFHELLGPAQYLQYCVKVSQLVSALTDDDYYLDNACEKSSNSNVNADIILNK